MSTEDRDTLYSLVINQLFHDGFGVFAISLKKIITPNSETIPSNKLLKLVQLGIAVSKYLEDSDHSKNISQIAQTFQTNPNNNTSLFSNSSSSNNLSVEQSPPQNGCQNTSFTLGVNQPLKLEPGDNGFNSFQFPFGYYQRPWAQVVNRINLHLDGEIHELPNNEGHTKLFECSLCGKVFNRRDKVKRHLSELHHGIKRHQCVTCSRLFSRNDKLIRHIMTVHQGIKAFGCLHCPRRFSRRWEHQRHMQTTHPTLNFGSPKTLQNRTPLQSPSPAKAPVHVSTSGNGTSNNNSSGSVLQPVVSPAPPTSLNTTPPSTVSTTPTTASATMETQQARGQSLFPVFPVFAEPTNPTSITTPSVTPVNAHGSSCPPGSSHTSLANNSVMFPMFPGINQNQTAASLPSSPTVPSFTSPRANSTTLSNTSVFPTNPSFALVTPYQMNYTNLMTPLTTPQASAGTTVSPQTSLTRMLL